MSTSCPIPTTGRRAHNAILAHNYGSVARGRAHLARKTAEQRARMAALADPPPPDSYRRKVTIGVQGAQKMRLNQAVLEARAIFDATGDRLAAFLHLCAAGIFELDAETGTFIRCWAWVRGGHIKRVDRVIESRTLHFRFRSPKRDITIENSTLAWALCWRVPVPSGFQLARVNGDRFDPRPENIRLATLQGQRWEKG